jgi:hypothetical protein
MATCRDTEGWKAVSRIRDFDTTPCFEEGVILSVLLGVLFLSAVWRSSVLSLLPPRHNNWWRLRVKLVSFLYPQRRLRSQFFNVRHSLDSRSLPASLLLSSYSTPDKLSLSFNITSSNQYLLLLRFCLPISIILGRGLLHQFYCSSGRCTRLASHYGFEPPSRNILTYCR